MVSAISDILGKEASVQGMISGLETAVQGAELSAGANGHGNSPLEAMKANIGAACRKCPGGHKPPEGGTVPAGQKSPEAAKEQMLQSIKPLLEAFRHVLAALKSEEPAQMGTGVHPDAKAISIDLA